MANESVEVSRVMLHNEGADLVVEVEVGGKWVEVIRAPEGQSSDAVSQIAEPAGLVRAAQAEAQPFPAWKWACGRKNLVNN